MARVTNKEVMAVIDTQLSEGEITPFVTAANLMVTNKLTGVYGADTLKEIERWLAAHLVAVRDPRIKSKSTADESTVYHMTSSIGEGLAMTPQGQQVQILDHLGKLSKKSGIVDMEAF
jgi:hypothetical protein